MKSYMTPLMFTGKSIFRIAVLACAIVFLSSNDVQATHIVGGDLTYQCLGGNMYRIRLTVRRDCILGAEDAPFDNPASIGLFDATTGQRLMPVGFPMGQFLIAFNDSDTLNEILVSDCSVVMGDVCVHTTVYDTVVALPYHANGYLFVYQRCCRNSSLNNVMDPLQTGMTLVAELSGHAQTGCNNSPQFGPFPHIYTCVNKEIVFDHSAFDLEGDSLVYELCTPLSGGSFSQPKPQPPTLPPYLPINFRPPYDLSNVMGGVPLQIDPITGLLTGTPNTIGQFVVGICVTAYDVDGNMTGKTRRDFQFNVRLCRDVPVAQFSAPSLDCEDLTVTFDNQSLLSDEFKWIFDYGNPLSDSTTEFEPTYTYSQPGFYNVALIVNDSMEFCFDTIVHQIGVFDSQIDADFSYNVSACSEAGIVLNVTDLSTGFDVGFPDSTFEWLLTVSPPGDIYPSTAQNPTFTFDITEPATACLTLVVTSTNGCSATQVKCFPVREISLAFNPASDSICFGDSTFLLIGGDTELTYIWDPTTGLDTTDPSNPIAYPGLSVTYFVTVTDGLCEVTGSTHVEVQQLPTLAFDYVTDCKSLTIQFDNNTMGGELYLWDFGVPNDTTDTSELTDPVFTFPDSGIYVVTLSSRDGCDVSISQEVTANAISETLEDQTVNCFMDSIALNPDFNAGYLYDWSDPLDDVPNPYATVDVTTEFFVTISSPGLPGCEIVDSITVIVPFDFTLDAGNDTTTCILADIPLTVTSNGNVEFIWTNAQGDTLSTGPVLVVTPSTTQTYYVTAIDQYGCFKTDSVMVTRPDPTFTPSPVNDTSYCNIQTITLSTQVIPGVTFEWFNSNDELIGQGPSVEVTPGTGPACFYFIAIETISLCEVSDTACLTPTFFDLDITDDQSICLDDSLTLCVTDNAGQDLDFIWSPIELIIHGGVTACPLVMPPSTTEYCVTVTNNAVIGECLDTLCTTVVVNNFDPLDVVISYDPPNPYLTQPITLSTNQPDTYKYIWEAVPPTVEPIPPVAHPTVVPTVIPTTFFVTVTNDEGCIEVASLSISVDDPECNETDIFLPNAFTPNNDGYNDVLYVRSNFISDFEIHIYNRWGEEVFKSFNASVGWDGTFRGERLPPDVYGYYMEIGCPNNKNYKEKGNITLLE